MVFVSFAACLFCDFEFLLLSCGRFVVLFVSCFCCCVDLLVGLDCYFVFAWLVVL